MAESMSTVIGKDAKLTGTIEVAGSLRIDGYIKGKVVSSETVVIGTTGKVEGDVDAKNGTIAGTVTGNVTVTEKVELQTQAVLYGDLKTTALVIEQGATFDGACCMKQGATRHEAGGTNSK